MAGGAAVSTVALKFVLALPLLLAPVTVMVPLALEPVGMVTTPVAVSIETPGMPGALTL
ncbi:hypothetical protein QO034_17220 [Sedimentitalea sp. JM2-8]|uniref:Uncharacterized protein n=1 Tax=Sedimentitalea xiamensis TaxID=3050037 RepID=A0ABT7FI64_9RHOB|nr:hypothetical protein [Sedimentitalea xiamensis]